MAALTAALMAMQGANAIGSFVRQRQQGNYEAAIAGQNAELADQNAGYAIERGAENESRSRMETRQVLGAQRASYAGGGVDVGTGSPVDMAGDTARIGELNAMTIRNNAALEAYGYHVEASSYRAEQANAKQRGRDAWTTLLTGATQAAGTYAANRSTSPAGPFGNDKNYAQWGAAVQRLKVGASP